MCVCVCLCLCILLYMHVYLQCLWVSCMYRCVCVHVQCLRVGMCLCVCVLGSHLVLLPPALLVVLQDVVPDVVLGVDEQLLGLPLPLSALHPHHEQQHHACHATHNTTRPSLRGTSPRPPRRAHARVSWTPFRLHCVLFCLCRWNP